MIQVLLRRLLHKSNLTIDLHRTETKFQLCRSSFLLAPKTVARRSTATEDKLHGRHTACSLSGL